MRSFIFILSCVLFFACQEKPAKELVNIGLGGNAYLTKTEQQEERGRDRFRLSDDGIQNWKDANDVISVYFHIEQPQTLNMDLRGSGNSTVNLSYKDKSYKVALSSDSLSVVKVGKFKIEEAGYVQIDIQGLEKTDETFGNIAELILKDPVGKVTYVHDFSNYWGRRGPSVHMGYKLPQDINIEWFYNEVTVPEEGDILASYYMANGFGEGYFGIQHNSPTERRVLFSVWSPFETDDPKSIPAEQQIKKLRQGEDVHIGEFGNEGSGGQSFLKYNWTPGTTYKFLTQVRPDGKGNTAYTAYFFATDENRWRLIASFLRPQTDTWYKGAHSFLENFSPNQGYLTRSVEFGNQWAMDTTGKWHELTEGTFTFDNTARAGVRLDYQGGVLENNRFYLMNGGFFNTNTEYRSKFERKPTGNQPEIDFESLKKL
ncbi:MAG: DUF3472 domain-containing protein [Bacteroidales bacterium]|nr:DUF3472 domain-containing protein [Bacteroidales bacterium]